MLRDHSKHRQLLWFIVRFHSQHGKMPSNKDISFGASIPYWRVSSMLTYLVRNGDLKRVKLRERACKDGPKYDYSLPDLNEVLS